MTLSAHAQRIAAGVAQANAAKKAAKTTGNTAGSPTNTIPNNTTVSNPVAGDPTGRAAAEVGLGKDALAAGEYISNTYVPQTVPQLATSRSSEMQGSINSLTGNIEQSGNVTSALDAQRAATSRTPEMANVLARQNDIATNGMGAQEFQAERDQMNQGIGSAYNTAKMGLAKAQAQGKVYGAAGAAQMANLETATNNTKANNEEQLFLQGEALKRSGLQDYSNTLNTQDAQLAANANAYSASAQGAQAGQTTRATAAAGQVNAAEAAETDKSKFNIGEQDANTAAKLGAVTNTAGLVNANKINEEQIGLGHDAIAAAGGKTTKLDAATSVAKKQATGKTKKTTQKKK